MAESDGFPVDEFTLAGLKHALGGSYQVDDDGTHHLVGSDFTVQDFLNFMSDYVPDRDSHFEGFMPDPTGLSGEEMVELRVADKPIYSLHDVIRALIQEVERLRNDGHA